MPHTRVENSKLLKKKKKKKKKKKTTTKKKKKKNRCHYTRVYPKVSGLASWSENCKWYRSLPLGAVVSLFCESI
jgi:hypothetical protein